MSTTTTDAPIIAIVERSSDMGIAPAVFLASSGDGARRAVFGFITSYLLDADNENDGTEIYGIDTAWLTEFPVPDADDPEAVDVWLGALQEQTTDMWVTLYTRQEEDEPDQVESAYKDVRN